MESSSEQGEGKQDAQRRSLLHSHCIFSQKEQFVQKHFIVASHEAGQSTLDLSNTVKKINVLRIFTAYRFSISETAPVQSILVNLYSANLT